MTNLFIGPDRLVDLFPAMSSTELGAVLSLFLTPLICTFVPGADTRAKSKTCCKCDGINIALDILGLYDSACYLRTETQELVTFEGKFGVAACIEVDVIRLHLNFGIVLVMRSDVFDEVVPVVPLYYSPGQGGHHVEAGTVNHLHNGNSRRPYK